MSKVEIFDPALCCPTGVCGPSVDPELTRVATSIFVLEKKGFDIKRYNLGTEPAKFVESKGVNEILHEKGPDSLPITLLNGVVVLEGSYPTNDQFSKWFDVRTEELNKKPKARLKIDLK